MSPSLRRICAAGVAVGFLLRIFGSSAKGLWHDEAHYILDATFIPWSKLLVWLPAISNYKCPLPYVLLKLWSLCAQGEFAWRLLPALTSCLTIVILYRIIRQQAGPVQAWISVALLSLNAQQLFYAHEVGPYPFLELACVLSFWATLKASSLCPRTLLACAGAHALAFLVHPFGLLGALTVPFRIGISRRTFLYFVLVLVALSLPVFYGLHQSWIFFSHVEGAWYPDFSWWMALPKTAFQAFCVRTGSLQGYQVGLFGIEIALMVSAVWVQRNDPFVRILSLWVALPVGCLYLCSIWKPVLLPSYVLPYSWALPVLAGLRLGSLRPRHSLPLLGVLMILHACDTYRMIAVKYPDYAKDRSTTRRVLASLPEGAVIVTDRQSSFLIATLYGIQPQQLRLLTSWKEIPDPVEFHRFQPAAVGIPAPPDSPFHIAYLFGTGHTVDLKRLREGGHVLWLMEATLKTLGWPARHVTPLPDASLLILPEGFLQSEPVTEPGRKEEEGQDTGPAAPAAQDPAAVAQGVFQGSGQSPQRSR